MCSPLKSCLMLCLSLHHYIFPPLHSFVHIHFQRHVQPWHCVSRNTVWWHKIYHQHNACRQEFTELWFFCWHPKSMFLIVTNQFLVSGTDIVLTKWLGKGYIPLTKNCTFFAEIHVCHTSNKERFAKLLLSQMVESLSAPACQKSWCQKNCNHNFPLQLKLEHLLFRHIDCKGSMDNFPKHKFHDDFRSFIESWSIWNWWFLIDASISYAKAIEGLLEWHLEYLWMHIYQRNMNVGSIYWNWSTTVQLGLWIL